MITLDASVVIAHLNPRERHHDAATELFRSSSSEELRMHSLNLAEVLVGGARIGRDAEMLADLETLGVRVVDRVDGESLRLARLRADTGLKLPDCCALEAAVQSESTLATFDEALATAARELGLGVATWSAPEP